MLKVETLKGGGEILGIQQKRAHQNLFLSNFHKLFKFWSQVTRI